MKPGLLLVDKPAGLTSHDVVARARRALGTKRVGHAGTLDPMATGLLVLGVGRATRLLTYLVGADKTYEATIRLGEARTTDDAEGELVSHAGALFPEGRPAVSPPETAALPAVQRVLAEGVAAGAVSAEKLEAAVAQLRGPILQAPSQVSAIKIGGKRAYARVRAGEKVDLPPRPVTVHSFEWWGAREARGESGRPVVDIEARVRCSSGTYIRALARDLGAALGTGGHLTALCRTAVEPFTIAEAAAVEDAVVLDLTAACQRLFPTVELSAAQAEDLGHGKTLPRVAQEGAVAAQWRGEVIALIENRGPNARALVVFRPAGQSDLE